MGSNFSNEFGQIHITIDRPSYFQGEFLHGSIFINLLKECPGNEILLKIKGKEETKWSEGSGPDFINYQGRKIILSHQFSLYKFNSSSIPNGQYAFPFSVFLPPTLPASFKNIIGRSAEISYQIKGKIKGHKDLHSSQNLILKQISTGIYASPFVQSRVEVDICCCFLGKWSTKFETTVNKTDFMEGQVALVDCTIDNSLCGLNLLSVELQLIRKVVVRTNNGIIEEENHVIFTSKVEVNVPARALTQAQTEFKIPIKDKKGLPSTTHGDIVRNTYFLSMSPNYENFLCNFDVEAVETPIIVYGSKEVEIPQVPATENWNPKVMPVENCDWKNAQLYQGKKAWRDEYLNFDYGMFQNNMIANDHSFFLCGEKIK